MSVKKAEKPKLIVVLGPTATGKSELALKLAKRLNTEIVSADSRQIYKTMDIGTAKPSLDKNYAIKGIRHHLFNVIAPNKQFSVAEYKNLALKAIKKIHSKGKIPILCGGTGLYISSVVNEFSIPEVKPDKNLRKKLEKRSVEELFSELQKIDPPRAKNIDPQNKRRLIRAIEIVKKTGKPVPQISKEPNFDILYIGIKKSLSEIKKLIDKRVDKMIKSGLEKEVKSLVKKYGWTTVLKNTIGYKEWREENSVKRIKANTFKFAKRQLTWFKKYPGNKINWVKDYQETEKLIKKFLKT